MSNGHNKGRTLLEQVKDAEQKIAQLTRQCEEQIKQIAELKETLIITQERLNAAVKNAWSSPVKKLEEEYQQLDPDTLVSQHTYQ